MSDKHLVTRPAAVFSALTVLSRILGLARDMIAAAFFGASASWDAFIVAFTFPNLFRRILGEGALNAAFVPVFSEYMHHKGKQEAWRIANIVVTLLTLVLLILSAVIISLLFLGEWLFPLSDRTKLIFELSQIMFPYVIFICLVGLFMGILNTFHSLAVPALAPALFNVVLIVGMLCVRWARPQSQMMLLAFIVLFGGFVELAIHFPVLRFKGMRFTAIFDWRHPAVKKILLLMTPMILGFGITQINIMVDRMLALWIGPGAVSTLYFGDRLMELPVGIFGIAFAVASLSVMSKQAARKDMAALKDTLNYSLRVIYFISLPATICLLVLRYPIVKVIFERDAFTEADTIACSRVVFCYGLGLLAFLSLKVITQCFYAMQDTKTPIKVGVKMVILNFILNVILMIPLREAGLALATTICAFLNMGILLVLLSKKLKGLFFKQMFYSFIRNSISALAMAVTCWFFTARLLPIGKNVFLLAIAMCAGAVVYLAVSIILGAKEPRELVINFRAAKESEETVSAVD